MAARDRIAVVQETCRRAGKVFRQGWHFLIPFAVLLYALFDWSSTRGRGALRCAAIFVVGLHPRL